MPRGGKRQGAGRKPIDPFDPISLWCAGELERMLFLDPAIVKARMLRPVRRFHPSDLPHHEHLDEYYAKLRAVPIGKRRELIAASFRGDDAAQGTILDDIEYVKKQLPGRINIPLFMPLSAVEIGAAYKEIARRGAALWGVRLTSRQVRRRVALVRKARKMRPL